MIATSALDSMFLDTDDDINEINLKLQTWKFLYLIFFQLFSWSDFKSGLSCRIEQLDLFFIFSKDKPQQSIKLLREALLD